MRLGRVISKDGVAFVAVDEGGGGDADPDTGAADPATRVREIKDHPFGEPEFTGRSWALGDVRLLAPILASKVVCVGKNYADHAREMGGEPPEDPVIFIKPSTAITGPGMPVAIPPTSGEVHYEGELAVVIGQVAKSVPAERASQVVLGYTCANDVTARDQQRHDGQWTRAKSHDSFCPLGPWIETDLDPSELRIRTRLDGRTVQDSSTAKLIHDVPALIEWVTEVMTLLPGDVILTGTPAGVGPMSAGQTVTVSVEGIGALTNPVGNRT